MPTVVLKIIGKMYLAVEETPAEQFGWSINPTRDSFLLSQSVEHI